MAIRVLIADDHKVVRQGLRLFLRIDPEIEVVGEANNGVEAIELTRQFVPDVILMDILMPVMDGIAATARIKKERPETEILGLTSILEDSAMIHMMRAGAIGYLLKDLDGDDLCRAIHAAAAGQVQLASQDLARLMRENHSSERADLLTEREKEVLGLLGRGQSNKQIARELQLREETIKTHVSKILHKLGVQSRTQAVLFALQSGLMPTK